MNLTAYQKESYFESGLESKSLREEFCEKNLVEFTEYVQENFKDIINDFKTYLHPESVSEDLAAFEWTLFEIFLLVVLDRDRFDVLARAFCESNWSRFRNFISDEVDSMEPDCEED